MNAYCAARTLGVVGGGLLAAAFLPMAIATAADNDAVGNAADFTWVGENNPWTDAESGFSLAPLFQSYEAHEATISLYAASDFDENGAPTGTPEILASITGDEHYTSFLGDMANFQYVVTDAGDFSSIEGLPEGFNAPTVGSVYDVFDFGNGFENVYSSVVVEDGSNVVTDTLVTPFGNIDLTWLVGGFDAAILPDDPDAQVPDLYDAFGLTDTGGDFDLGFGDLSDIFS